MLAGSGQMESGVGDPELGKLCPDLIVRTRVTVRDDVHLVARGHQGVSHDQEPLGEGADRVVEIDADAHLGVSSYLRRRRGRESR